MIENGAEVGEIGFNLQGGIHFNCLAEPNQKSHDLIIHSLLFGVEETFFLQSAQIFPLVWYLRCQELATVRIVDAQIEEQFKDIILFTKLSFHDEERSEEQGWVLMDTQFNHQEDQFWGYFFVFVLLVIPSNILRTKYP